MPGRAFAPDYNAHNANAQRLWSQSRDARESVRAWGPEGIDSHPLADGLNPVMPGRAFAPSKVTLVPDGDGWSVSIP